MMVTDTLPALLYEASAELTGGLGDIPNLVEMAQLFREEGILTVEQLRVRLL